MKHLVIALVLLASCSIQHRSDGFACTKQSDCNNGRTCTDGFCVLPGGGGVDAPGSHVDAPGTHADAATCPAGCSTCNVTQHTCTIDCRSSNCNGAVACPAGYKCDIMCDSDNSCRNGVDCTAALSCNITCSGGSSCRTVQCGLGPCDVACSGNSSCRGVACGNSCACDVTCTGNQSCLDTIQCTSLACKSGLGCTSVPTVCHSCP
ncbi:MAG: hypothetical protein JO257_28545 [Deltaproteobacteria bacterium]|nr:hypothetical protein [Deltaproteobacteria bacterium]